MPKGKITYCIIDETDPSEEFECEGKVIEQFFKTSPLFEPSNCISRIQKNVDVENFIRSRTTGVFHIFHLAAHGAYYRKGKGRLDYSVILSRRGKEEREIFRHDTIVRSGLEADVFVSTCCQSFNDAFLDTLEHYEKVWNFIAPAREPLIGETILFSLLFYNDLLRNTKLSASWVKDDTVKRSFLKARKAFLAYGVTGDFRLYVQAENREYP